MRLAGPRIVYSPSDLCRFMESKFATWMDRLFLESSEGLEPDRIAEDIVLAGVEHERACIADLVAAGEDLETISRDADRMQATRDAMRAGRQFIHQAALCREPFEGFADLLVRAEGRSALGGFHYVPREIKLARSPRPKHIVQLCAYADMLEAIQEVRPQALEITLGTRKLVRLRTADYFHCYRQLRRSLLELMREFDPAAKPVPEPGPHHGRWSSHAEARLLEIDHLSRVAGIRRSQIKRLESAGITTMRGLAESRVERVPRLERGIFDRLRRQARLQVESEGSDRVAYEVLLPDPAGPPRGLALLPPPSPDDVFFDMEGYPHVEGGLEYLFGATYVDGGERGFRDWWAHDREQERTAFEAFVDWIHDRWRRDPSMHVYHYAAYEVSALRRLMGRHGTREVQVDQLLRNEVFVDLYAIVRHAVMVGEPGYSIKNLETLFRPARSTEVETAADSIVQYRRWMDSGESEDWRVSRILGGIRDYNRDDCDSTLLLADWLRRRQREHGVEYRGKTVDGEPPAPADELGEHARRRRQLAEELLRAEDDATSRLLGQLVEFHRREDKPMWWEMFHRHGMSDDELYEDLACLGRLRRTAEPAVQEGRSKEVWYEFDPDQDSKLDRGNTCYLAHDLGAKVRIAELDRERGRALVRFGPKVLAEIDWPPPMSVSLIPDAYVPSQPIEDSIERTARRWKAGRPLPPALNRFLGRLPPTLNNHAGGPLVDDGETPSDAAVRLVSLMDQTTLSIQGPPGSGKTFTAARMILDLLQRGKRVGVTSNGHKAILNLMVKCAELKGEPLPCLKVAGDADDPLLSQIPGVQHVSTGPDGARRASEFSLIGGTAWLFSRPEMQGSIDYLFIDEAGQVSVANLVAMAPSTENLVLVGDQMQLAQPIQGSHPDDSGASTLEYLLEGRRTIPDDRGLFLDVTYRLHPDICRVSSEAFYEGKLHSAPGCENRRIVPPPGRTSPVIRDAGIVFLPVEHEGNTQGSDEEARIIRGVVRELIGCRHTDRAGRLRGPLTLDDVLVVAPYNMQVRKLQKVLPGGARVGSVDKFQGQEAPVVILSMCASEGHDSPRGIEFLLNPNRINVALSRARSLAIVVGHPGLARSRCSGIDQLRLVSLYCRIVEEGAHTPRQTR